MPEVKINSDQLSGVNTEVKEKIDIGLGLMTPPAVDAVQVSYSSSTDNQNEKDFLLARTFRSGGGAVIEYSYMINDQGYIFCNPTTLVSKKIPSKTISQFPGNDWTGEPSFLYAIHTPSIGTIANYGIANVNSFASTEALGLLAYQGLLGNEKTIVAKLDALKGFCLKHWLDNISRIKNEIYNFSKSEQMKESYPDDKKTFQKKHPLVLHTKNEYSEILASLESLETTLVAATSQFEEDMKSTLTPLQKKKAKKNVKKKGADINWHSDSYQQRARERIQQLIATDEKLTDEKKTEIYGNYWEYMNSGLRHNEMVSRLYPWEINGIEWGSVETGSTSNENAVADLIEITIQRAETLKKIEEEGLDNKLFNDFMKNKLAIDRNIKEAKEVESILEEMKKTEPGKEELNKILSFIKDKLKAPICIYQYNVLSREMINISKLVHTDQASPQAKEAIQKINSGIVVFNQRHQGKVTVAPKSKVRDVDVYITFPELKGFAKYWENKDSNVFNEQRAAIYAEIAKKIINQPYVDDNRQLVIAKEKGFELLEMSEDIKQHKEAQAREGYVYIDKKTGRYISRYQGEIHEGSVLEGDFLDTTINSDALINDFEDPKVKHKILTVISQRGHARISKNETVYRPNHDVTHACRKAFYLESTMQMLIENNIQPWQKILEDFSEKEKACLHLAAYLSRSGRTNEKGSSEDPTATERSANIFQKIATDLGFDQMLIEKIAGLIKTHMAIGKSSYVSPKDQAYKRLLDFSHSLDLVRCNSWREFFEDEAEYEQEKNLRPTKVFQFELVKGLNELISKDPAQTEQAKNIVSNLLELAKKACELTGVPVRYNKFSAEEKVQNDDLTPKDSEVTALLTGQGFFVADKTTLKALRGHWTNHVGEMLATLAMLERPGQLSPRPVLFTGTSSSQVVQHGETRNVDEKKSTKPGGK